MILYSSTVLIIEGNTSHNTVALINCNRSAVPVVLTFNLDDEELSHQVPHNVIRFTIHICIIEF